MDSSLIIAESKDSGQRIDVFLAQRLPEFSRAQLTEYIKKNLVTVNGKSLKPSHKIVGHESVLIQFPAITPSSLKPQNIPLDIIFDDDDIAVINKPAGLVVHPGAGVKEGTLCHALLYHFPNMVIGNEERPGIVHRLDKDTSGIMVVAKSHKAMQILSDDFKHRRVKKIYRALSYGEFQAQQFSLKTGHARHPHNRLRFSTRLPVPESPSSHVRLAHSDFVVLRQKYGISSLKVTLHTGRTHQIRAHLADIQRPILGDNLYGGNARCLSKNTPPGLNEAMQELSGQALFAETLELTHPISKAPMSFSAPLPALFSAIDSFLI